MFENILKELLQHVSDHSRSIIREGYPVLGLNYK
jgi:hypothetical protein